jgi:uncharacterized protein (DUF58 family)
MSVALNHVVNVLNRRSVVLLVGDFMDGDFESSLRAVSRRHDTVAVHLLDPREIDLPKVGLLELTDAETNENVVIDTGSDEVRRQFREQSKLHSEQVEQVFLKARVDRIPIHTNEGYVEPLIRFFRYRNRR